MCPWGVQILFIDQHDKESFGVVEGSFDAFD
jgi:hypothetical protein